MPGSTPGRLAKNERRPTRAARNKPTTASMLKAIPRMSPDEIRAAITSLQALLPENAHRVTVAEIVQRYLASVEFQALEERGVEEARFRLHVIPWFGSHAVADLTNERLAEYRQARKAEGGNGNGLTRPATRNREIRRMSAALTWAAREKIVSANPILRAPMEPEDNLRRTCPTTADVNRILLAARSSRLRAMIATGFWSGLRRGEIVAIESSQVNWDDGLLVLRGSQTKSGKPRTTIFPARASSMVADYLAGVRTPGRFLFATKSGRPIGARNFLRDFQAVVKRAGVEAADGERLVLHDLRSGFVGRQLELGTAEKTIMEMTGHSTHAAFDRYVRVQKRWLIEARERTDLAELAGAVRHPPKRALIIPLNENATNNRENVLTAGQMSGIG